MQDSVYLKILGMTRTMLTMAKKNDWDGVSKTETQRKILLEEISPSEEVNNHIQKNKIDKLETVNLLKKIAEINKVIETLAEEIREDQKSSLVQLQKGKKIKHAYSNNPS